MRYVSTRGRIAESADALPFSAVLLEGLAFDGGLAVPESYPRFSTSKLAALRPLGYRDLAFEVLSRFVGDVAPADLRRIVDRTYTAATFGSDEITPLETLAPGFHLLQASNGPTLAFKDVALQLLGNLFEHVLAREGRTLNILGATSGDTGSSAEHAMLGKRGVRVFMLSPHGRMSPFQQAQMYAIDDPSIHNIAIRGSFDDCQDIVKAIAGDAGFKRRHALGAVNSINWARIAAQAVYYFKGCFAAARDGGAVQFAVPLHRRGQPPGWVHGLRAALGMGQPRGLDGLQHEPEPVLVDLRHGDRFEVGLVVEAEVAHGRDAHLPGVLGLRQEHERPAGDDPPVARIAPRPRAVVRGHGGAQEPAWAQDAVELAELVEEGAPVPLGAQVLQHLVGVDLVEGVALEGVGQGLEVVHDVRAVVGVVVESGEVRPVVDSAGVGVGYLAARHRQHRQPAVALATAADQQLALQWTISPAPSTATATAGGAVGDTSRGLVL